VAREGVLPPQSDFETRRQEGFWNEAANTMVSSDEELSPLKDLMEFGWRIGGHRNIGGQTRQYEDVHNRKK
jgi:hypothetical protein